MQLLTNKDTHMCRYIPICIYTYHTYILIPIHTILPIPTLTSAHLNHLQTPILV
jgi:hypothetical protein